MKLIIPFSSMNQWTYERYKDQFRAYCREFDKVTVPVYMGETGEVKNDIPNLEFNIFRQRRKGDQPIKIFLKDKLYRLLIFPILLRRILEKDRSTEYWSKEIDGDAILGYSGSGINQIQHIELAEALGIPAIHRMRGDGVTERKLSNASRHTFNISNRYHYKSLPRYDFHIPISFDYYDKLVFDNKIPKHKVSNPIGLGIDTEAFKRQRHTFDKIRVGYFGRMSQEKNIGFLFEVMRQTPEIEYIVLGHEQIEGIVYPDNCHYLGFVDKTEMPQYYDLVNVIVNPSLSEGFPNTLLEAYATETPFIGSKVSFPQGIPIHGEALDLKVDLWVKTLRGLKLNKVQRIGKRARREALYYSWENFGKRMFNEIQGVVEK